MTTRPIAAVAAPPVDWPRHVLRPNALWAGAQSLRFALVGAANTAIDFVVFQLLALAIWPSLGDAWAPKAVSGFAAMTFSFVANRKWVFRAPTGRRAPGQALRFVAVTLVGAYLIQAPLVGFLTPLVGPLAGRFSDAARVLPLHGVLVRPEFWARSIAFAVATGVSMCWTFLTYRHWVFRPSARQTGKPS